MTLTSYRLVLLVILLVFSDARASSGDNPKVKVSLTPRIVAAVAFSPDNRVVAAGGYKIVTIVEASSGHVLNRLLVSCGVVSSVRFSPDGSMLAASSGIPGKSGEIRIWNAKTWNLIETLHGHDDAIYSLAFSPNGRQIAACSYDHLVSLWTIGRPRSTIVSSTATAHAKKAPSPIRIMGRPQSGSQLQARIPNFLGPRYLKDHTDSVYAVAFSPDGRMLASAAGDRTVKVWDAATGKRLFTLSESTAELYAVAFSPDGTRIAAGGVDKTLRVWDVTQKDGRLAKSAFAHDSPILGLAFSRDSKSIYTCGEDQAVKRFDAATLEERMLFPKQPDWPHGIALSPDDRILAVGRQDGSLALYSASSGRLLRTPLGSSTTTAHEKESTDERKSVQVPTSSSIPGVKPGDRTRKPRKTGGITLNAASLGSISPTGIARGTSAKLTLFGGLISDATGVFFDDPAIAAKLISPPDANKGILRTDAKIGPTARIGIHRVFVQTPHGTTGSVTFAVGGWPEVAEAEPNDSPDKAQSLQLPCTVIGSMNQPGDVDSFRFEARNGEELVFEVVAQLIRSRLQPVLAILDSRGNVIAESKTQIGRPDAILGHRFEKAGQYTLQLRDYEGSGGGDVYYRINAGEFPIVTEVWPTGVQKGSTTDLKVAGFNLGGQTSAKVIAPKSSSWGATFEFQMQTPSGPLLYPVRLAVGEDPEVSQRPENDSLKSAQRVTLPVTINGKLFDVSVKETARSDGHISLASTSGPPNPSQGSQRSFSQYYRFSARKGQRLVLEVMARRLGSPLDSEIEILNSEGNPIERAVLRAVGKTEQVLNDRDSVSSGIRLQAWDDFHINDYLLIGREVIRIRALPEGPDNDMVFRILRGQRLGYLGTTPEFHSLGSQVYKVEIHPPGATFSPNGFPLTKIYYRNDDGSPLYGKDSQLDFAAPADGDYYVRISDARGQQGEDYTYRLMIHEPRPDFKVFMSPDNPNLPKGGGMAIEVSCERYEGFDGPIDVQMEGLPAGFSASKTTIETGETSANILLTASPEGIPAGKEKAAPIKLVARAAIMGRDIVKTIDPDNGTRLVTILPDPDIRVTTDVREVVLRPGQEAEIEARVERLGNFGSRVPVNVMNLPFGVRVMDVGLNGVLITEEQDSRKFRLYCEPWVKPQTRSIYVFGDVEGGVRNAAAPLVLRVEPVRARTDRKKPGADISAN